MKHIGTVKLETKRLILRRFEYADSEAAFRNWTGDPEVTRFLRWKHHRDISEMRSLAEFWIKKYSDKEWYHWVIIPKSVGKAIGTISAARVDNSSDTIEVGYCIGAKFQNSGYTTEALSEVIRFFIRKVGAGRIEAKHDLRNKASGRVMEKCGMSYEGTLRRADRNNMGIVDVCVYSILAEELTD